MQPQRTWLGGVALAFVLLASGGCARATIPNTDVEDTEFNRSVVQFCEEYRRAVETRNVGVLLKLAAPSYYEDGGNVDPADDLDYAGLRDYLKDRFRKAKAIRYEIRYRRVGTGSKQRVLVDYTYSASYKLPSEKGDLWHRRVAENRLELLAHNQSFLIVAGM